MPFKTFKSDFLPIYMPGRQLVMQSNVHSKANHSKIPIINIRILAEIQKVGNQNRKRSQKKRKH